MLTKETEGAQIIALPGQPDVTSHDQISILDGVLWQHLEKRHLNHREIVVDNCSYPGKKNLIPNLTGNSENRKKAAECMHAFE